MRSFRLFPYLLFISAFTAFPLYADNFKPGNVPTHSEYFGWHQKIDKIPILSSMGFSYARYLASLNSSLITEQIRNAASSLRSKFHQWIDDRKKDSSGGAKDDDPEPLFDTSGWSPSMNKTPHFFLQPADQFKVQENHPRLYFRHEDMEWIRARASGSYKEIWNDIQWIASIMPNYPPDSAKAIDNLNGYDGNCGQLTAFVGVIDNNAVYKNWAMSWGKALSAKQIPTDDTQLRATLARLAIVYDWLYDDLGSEDRETIRSALIQYIQALQEISYMKNPGYIGGHERWGLSVLAMAALALSGDYDEADALIAECRQHIATGLYPAQAWIAENGGYQMGWAYTSAYTNFDLPYWIWTTATNDVLLDDWLGETAYWYLYGLKGDNRYPQAGDTFGTDVTLGAENLIYSAGITKNAYAEWFIENKFRPNILSFYQILMRDEQVKAESPANLPLGRLFRNSGVVIARDSWDENATLLTFTSSSFFSTNHHHRDNNTFTLDYKGALAIDSGYYDSYGSSHWKNYYTRTIAHNGITVFDPTQVFRVYGSSIANDGGQIFYDEPLTLADIKLGGGAHLEGIGRFENRPAFTYTFGNASKSYDTSRVRQAKRDIVFLRKTNRPHPVVIIFDRVESSNPDFIKTFHLHSVNQPLIDHNSATISQGDGRLTSLTLYPRDAQLAVIGGSGSEFMVNGSNYPIFGGSGQGIDPAKGVWPGAWRLEVRPSTQNRTDYFLHSLFVDDSDDPPVSLNEAKLFESASGLGVNVAGWSLFFPYSTEKLEKISFTTVNSGQSHYVITGFEPGQHVQYSLNGQFIASVQSGEGGCAVFDLTTNPNDSITVTPE
jgi:hypothetical protein